MNAIAHRNVFAYPPTNSIGPWSWGLGHLVILTSVLHLPTTPKPYSLAFCLHPEDYYHLALSAFLAPKFSTLGPSILSQVDISPQMICLIDQYGFSD